MLLGFYRMRVRYQLLPVANTEAFEDERDFICRQSISSLDENAGRSTVNLEGSHGICHLKESYQNWRFLTKIFLMSSSGISASINLLRSLK